MRDRNLNVTDKQYEILKKQELICCNETTYFKYYFCAKCNYLHRMRCPTFLIECPIPYEKHRKYGYLLKFNPKREKWIWEKIWK